MSVKTPPIEVTRPYISPITMMAVSTTINAYSTTAAFLPEP
jgi:hypothetical protein